MLFISKPSFDQIEFVEVNFYCALQHVSLQGRVGLGQDRGQLERHPRWQVRHHQVARKAPLLETQVGSEPQSVLECSAMLSLASLDNFFDKPEPKKSCLCERYKVILVYDVRSGVFLVSSYARRYKAFQDETPTKSLDKVNETSTKSEQVSTK